MQPPAASGTKRTTHDRPGDAEFHEDVIYLAFAPRGGGTTALQDGAAKAANLANRVAGDGRSCR